MSFPWVAAAGLASSIGTNIFNQIGAKKNREYNSPKNQMARFKEAGLNPHLIYGQGNAGNAAERPEIKDSGSDAIKFISEYQGIKNAIKQEQLLDAQHKTELQKAMNMAETRVGLQLKNDLGRDTYFADKDAAHQRVKLNDLKIAQNEIFNSELPDRLKGQLSQIISSVALNKANTSYTQVRSAVEKEILRLRKADVNPNSPMWEKILGQILDNVLKKMNIKFW